MAPTIACIICLTAGLAGCKKDNTGPKRPDHQAARTPRYHPHVDRTAAPAPPATQPAAEEIQGLPQPGLVGSPVLFVNGEAVTVQDILEPIIEELHRRSRALSERDYFDSALSLVRGQIDQYVSSVVVYQQAKLKYSDKKVQEALDKEADRMVRELIQEQFGGIYARYEAHLRALEFKPDDIKERMKRQAMVREYLRERFKPMLREPPRRELLKYYQERLAEFTLPENAEMFLIEISLAEHMGKPLAQATQDELDQARRQARLRLTRALEELESGVDFATVARAYSTGPLAAQGGAWGQISPGSLAGRWAEAGNVLFTLQPGQISGVLDTDESVFIVKCGSHTPAEQLPFEKAQRQIIDQLLDEQFARLRVEYIQDLLNRATILREREFFQSVLAAVPKPSRDQAAASPTGS